MKYTHWCRLRPSLCDALLECHLERPPTMETLLILLHLQGLIFLPWIIFSWIILFWLCLPHNNQSFSLGLSFGASCTLATCWVCWSLGSLILFLFFSFGIIVPHYCIFILVMKIFLALKKKREANASIQSLACFFFSPSLTPFSLFLSHTFFIRILSI